MKKAQDGVQAAIQKQKEKRAAIQAASDARKSGAMEKRKASLTIRTSDSASEKAKEEARAKEAAKTKAAIDAQKQKRESVQAAYDKKKEDGMAARRAKGLPASPAPKVQTATIKSPKSKATSDYRLYSEREIDNYTPTSREPEKRKSVGGGGKRKVARTAAVPITAKRDITKQGAPSKPSVPGIQKGPAKRKFSDSEIKTMEIMQKGKQADGTMSESAQRKIQAVRAKQRASNEKALRKSARASKFNAKQIRKSAK